jgi:hypothetical protein
VRPTWALKPGLTDRLVIGRDVTLTLTRTMTIRVQLQKNKTGHASQAAWCQDELIGGKSPVIK